MNRAIHTGGSASPDDSLWRRIDALRLDDPDASLTFTRRLARENGWSVGFAARVVDEYKRFVYLAMTAGHEVTPSDEVDQAWHLHLTYTRSYWGDLCGEVLGRPLHHGPTKGGASEGDRFFEQYGRTLASYRTAFGNEPPADVWPPATVRFGEAAAYVRVNESRSWVVPKPWRVGGGRPLAVAGSFLVMAPPLAAGAAINPLDFNGTQFLTFYAAVAVVAVLSALVCRHVLRAQHNPMAEPPQVDDTESIAALRGGWQAVYQSALVELIHGEAVEVRRQRSWFSSGYRVVALRDPGPGDNELQRAILKHAGAAGATLADLSTRSQTLAERPVERLERDGLLETKASFQSARLAMGLILGATFLLGVAKLFVGLWRIKPVGLLVGELAVLGVVSLLLLTKPRLTRAGKHILKGLLASHERLKKQASAESPDLPASEMALAAGLFGVAACGAPELEPLQQAISSTAASSGGCGTGGSSGCGGGGCGGGCGGCGG